MALSAQQEETLERLRARGLKQPANMLEGLYGQINERPDDEQITEMIANMLQQYMRADDAFSVNLSPVVGAPSLDSQSFLIIAESDSVDLAMVGTSVVDVVPGQAYDNVLGHPVPPAAGMVQMDVEGDGVLKWVYPPDEPSKPRIELVPFDFIIAMASVMQEGLKNGRNVGDWQKPDQADKRGSLLRHYAAREWAAVAVNAMIMWWHDRRSK